MGMIKDVFNKRTLLNCIVFSLPASILFLWRFTYVKEIPFFSVLAAQVYLFFVAANFIIVLLVFIILHWLSNRPQKD